MWPWDQGGRARLRLRSSLEVSERLMSEHSPQDVGRETRWVSWPVLGTLSCLGPLGHLRSQPFHSSWLEKAVVHQTLVV